MKRFTSNNIIFLSNVIFWISFSTAIAISLLPFWPENRFFSIVGYLLLFAPRWWIFILPISIFIVFKHLTMWQRGAIIPITILTISFLDVAWFPRIDTNAHGMLELPIISVNIGNSSNKNILKKSIETNAPYLVLLQEAREQTLIHLFDDNEWNIDCAGTLCIASRLPIKRIASLNRSKLGGWGNYAAKYEIDFFGEKLQLINVHLDTPRSILESLLHRSVNERETDRITFNRRIQVSIINNWVDRDTPTIIAGDFNMPTNENIYRKNLGHLNNALDSAEFGFRYTKHTKWHGIRIDHILFNNFFIVKNAKVLDDFGGDHRPIFTVLGQTI